MQHVLALQGLSAALLIEVSRHGRPEYLTAKLTAKPVDAGGLSSTQWNDDPRFPYRNAHHNTP
jgi:hypothetical protein